MQGCGILVPQPGIELISPALQGRFLTTGPLGKSHEGIFFSSTALHCLPRVNESVHVKQNMQWKLNNVTTD